MAVVVKPTTEVTAEKKPLTKQRWEKNGGNNNDGNQSEGRQPNPQQQLQQLQQQMKGFQDLKLSYFKDSGQAPKAVKFSLPKDDGMSDDEFEV